MAQQPVELRPMGVGDIFDVIFRMYRTRFAPFLLIALAVYIPYGIVAGLFQSAADAPAQGPGAPPAAAMVIGGILTFLMAFVAMPLCQGAMLHQISAAYLGNPIGAAESYRRALPRLMRLLAANIIGGIIIMIGFLLLIVPGVIFSLWFMVVTAVVMMESAGPIDALSRSKQLMSGNLGKGFLIGLVSLILAFLIGIVGGVVSAMLPLESSLLQTLIESLVQALIIPIQTGAMVLLYYDLRIRKEAFDLEQLATQLNEASPAQIAGDVQPPLAP